MSELLFELMHKSRVLPDEEKVLLVDELLASIAPPDPAVDAAWAAEIKRRLEAADRGEIEFVPADVALAEIRQELDSR